MRKLILISVAITSRLIDRFISIIFKLMSLLGRDPEQSQIKFNLYTKRTGENEYVQTIVKENILRDVYGTNFDNSKPTKVFIHGWQQTGTPPKNKNDENYGALQYIVKAYMTSEEDVNLFMVDWGKYSSSLYFSIATETVIQKVGFFVGQMLTSLINDFDVEPSNIHLIGHSLGAHIAHYAVDHLGVEKKIARITGLDPALPRFHELSLFPAVDGLGYSHAEFIDVIHTNGGGLGLLEKRGHADFYVNGGILQRGCPKEIKTYFTWMNVGSHNRAVNYFAESIKTKVGFYGKKREVKGVDEEFVIMGEKTPKTARGYYDVNTNATHPFAMGKPLK